MEVDLLLRDFVGLVSANLQKQFSQFQSCALPLDRFLGLSDVGRRRIRIDAVTFGNWKSVQHSLHHSAFFMVYSVVVGRRHPIAVTSKTERISRLFQRLEAIGNGNCSSESELHHVQI